MLFQHRQRGAVAAWLPSRELSGALLAGAVVHLLLLVPTLVALQIYDRVLSSRRIETLAMLLVAAVSALAAWWLLESSRVRWHAARAAELEQRCARELVPWLLHAPAPQTNALAQQLWRDLAALRAAAGGPLLIAATDLPWTLVYLGVIAAFHPWLGAVALAGIVVLLALAWLTELRLRNPASDAEQAQSTAQRKAGEIAGFIELVQGHGQQAQAGDALLAIKAQAAAFQLAAELPGHSLKTAGKLARQLLQLLMLATGAWLVVQTRKAPWPGGRRWRGTAPVRPAGPGPGHRLPAAGHSAAHRQRRPQHRAPVAAG